MSELSVKLEKYSIGVGDRFAQEAEAQLMACVRMAEQGVEVIPVWNKSHREHLTVGSDPSSVRAAAEAAVRKLGWSKPWHVDADHIRLETVDGYLPYCDFYTIDVADTIGQPAAAEDIRAFVDRHPELVGRVEIAGIETPFTVTRAEIERIAAKYLAAVREAGRIYRHIAAAKGEGRFITEVSMDETSEPQTPPELLVILAALADEGIPVQTLAPKFTGRFNKGVDYVGDIRRFEQEFNAALAVIAFAVRHYGLPDNLKLSIHSGSDKFSIFPVMARALRRHNAGLHLKTAGTTWLEELIGLAEAGGEGLALAREIYFEALRRMDELCAPYASVIDIDRAQLPSPEAVARWDAARFAAAVRHDPANPEFNPHMRQLLHVAYKIAAQKSERFLHLVRSRNGSISRNVTFNLLERHLKPLFLPNGSPRSATTSNS
jgi:hypothetical protein